MWLFPQPYWQKDDQIHCRKTNLKSINSPVCHPGRRWSGLSPLSWCCHPGAYQVWHKMALGHIEDIIQTKRKMYYQVIDTNSPNLQTNLVYHIINISQRLWGNMKTGIEKNMKQPFVRHPKIHNVWLKVEKCLCYHLQLSGRSISHILYIQGRMDGLPIYTHILWVIPFIITLVP